MSDSVQKYSASRMGSAPIGPLLLSCSVPMMISMLVQALYNIVDSIFVSRVNEAALSAVSLAFPIQNLMIAFAVGTAVGVNAYLSRCLGEGNRAEASRAAMNGLFLAFCGGIAFLVFGILGARAFIASQTTDAQIMQYGADYLSICTLWCMGLFLQCMLEKLLVATGRSAFAMASQLIGALVNIALDPIFIFGLFGVPRMEAAGAAVATVAGQWIGAAAGLTMNLLCNKDINLTLKGFRPAGSTIKRIYAVGIPSIAMNAIGSVMTFAMNNILIAFSSTAVAVFGVYFKLQSFVFMPIFGINNGMVPIIGYNYGARRPARVRKAMLIMSAMILGYTAIMWSIILLEPGALIRIFSSDETLIRDAVPALKQYFAAFICMDMQYIGQTVFKSLNKKKHAIFFSLLRKVFIVVPLTYLMPYALHMGTNGVFLAEPVSNVIGGGLCFFTMLLTVLPELKRMERKNALYETGTIL